MTAHSISKKELKKAARIYSERWTSALENNLDQTPVQFSPDFQAKMAALESSTDAAIIKRHRIRKRVIAACLAVILLITAFFSFNTTARAEFVNWIKDLYKEFVVYRIFGEKTSDSLPEFIPGWMPEEMQLTLSEISEDHRTLLYENADRSVGFDISCDRVDSGSAVYVSDVGDERQHLAMTIAGYEVDCYISDTDNSDYVWHDKEGKLFFTMGSNLPHETNVKIIENLKIVK